VRDMRAPYRHRPLRPRVGPPLGPSQPGALGRGASLGRLEGSGSSVSGHDGECSPTVPPNADYVCQPCTEGRCRDCRSGQVDTAGRLIYCHCSRVINVPPNDSLGPP
jgi:hypothetical protein